MKREKTGETVWQERAGKTVCIGCAAVTFFLLMKYALGVLAPFLIAVVLACLLSPLAERLARVSRLPRKLCAVCLVGFLFLLCLGVCSVLIGRFVREAEALLLRLPSAGNSWAPWDTWYLRLPSWARERLAFLWAGWKGEVGAVLSALLKRIAKATPSTVMGTVCGAVATVFLTVGGRELAERGLAWLPPSLQRTGTVWLTALRRTVRGYAGAMLVLFLLTFLQAFCGLLLLRQPYALLCALVIAAVDALPVLGSGTVLLPWALVRLIAGDGWAATGLLALYGSLVLTRQLAEPKLMGAGLGLHPVLTMLAMTLGLRWFGAGGMLLMPLLLSLGLHLTRTKEFSETESL